nr:MAG TPA: antitoxin [Caudoviricetes sp.]
MSNVIPITVRISDELKAKLSSVTKRYGFTRTNFLRIGIFDYLVDKKYPFNPYELKEISKEHRLVLNVNQIAYDSIKQASLDYDISVNSVIISIAYHMIDRFSKE